MADRGLWLLFLRKGQAFIPTMARTDAGFYMGVEPVEVVDMRDQIGAEQVDSGGQSGEPTGAHAVPR
jgi:hypothetical protein